MMKLNKELGCFILTVFAAAAAIIRSVVAVGFKTETWILGNWSSG